MDFFRHDLALTQKSTFDFRIRATKPYYAGHLLAFTREIYTGKCL